MRENSPCLSQGAGGCHSPCWKVDEARSVRLMSLGHCLLTGQRWPGTVAPMNFFWGQRGEATWGGLSQQPGAQVTFCRPPGTRKQPWDPVLLLALYFCSPSTVPALPGCPAECAVPPAVMASALIHGYSKEPPR